MLSRLTCRGRPLLALMNLFETRNPYDAVDEPPNPEYDNLTGFQRLQRLFIANEKDIYIDSKLAYIFNTCAMGMFLGAIYGGVTSTRYTFIRFIENNEATQFYSHSDAKRRLADQMFTSFIKGGSKMAFKVSFFCTTFIATYIAVSVYRNKDSAMYYSLSGVVAGSLYKFPLGPKGMVAGGFFGFLFGSLYGVIRWFVMVISGLNEEHLRQIAYEGYFKKNEKKRIFMKQKQHAEEQQELKRLVEKY